MIVLDPPDLGEIRHEIITLRTLLHGHQSAIPTLLRDRTFPSMDSVYFRAVIRNIPFRCEFDYSGQSLEQLHNQKRTMDWQCSKQKVSKFAAATLRSVCYRIQAEKYKEGIRI